jgi:hypothetical protein
VSIQLAKPIIELRGWELGFALFAAGLSVITNMALGFAAGLAVAHLVQALRQRCSLSFVRSKEEDDEPDV